MTMTMNPEDPISRDSLFFRNLARVNVEGQLSGEEIQQVNVEVEFPGNLFKQVAARRMAQVMLDVVEVRTRNRPALFVRDARCKLPLSQLRLLARLYYDFTKSSHRIPRRFRFLVNRYVGQRLFVSGRQG